MDEEEDLTEYINSLDWNSGQDVETFAKVTILLKTTNTTKN
jgi:hypothetical protein